MGWRSFRSIIKLEGCTKVNNLDFKFLELNLIHSVIPPLWKGRRPSFEQTWIPLTYECNALRVKSGWNWPSGSGEEVYRQTDRRSTDNMLSESYSSYHISIVFCFFKTCGEEGLLCYILKIKELFPSRYLKHKSSRI